MKMIKKLALLLCLVMALSAFAVNAFAAEEANIVIEADKTVVEPGDTVTITVSLDNAAKLEGGVWSVYFELVLPEGLTIVPGSSDVPGDVFTLPEFDEDLLLYGTMGRFGSGYTGAKTTLVTFQVTVDAQAAGDLVIAAVAETLELTDENGDAVTPSVAPTCKLHMHAYTGNVVAPTCTEKGYTEYTCACGDSYKADFVNALGHDMGAWTVVTNPSCTVDGSKTRACNRNCGHTETEAIPATGHDHVAVVTAPTCTEQGYTTYTCACGDSYKADFVNALGHDMGAWTVVTNPSCTVDGSKTRACNRNCGHTETEAIPATGHDHVAVVTAPTCTEQGYTTYTCACGDSYKADFVNALGHDWDDGTVTVEPTEETTGVRTYCCKRCDATYTETIPTLEHVHKYEAVVTNPTCTEEGYTTYICACGDSYKADFVDALGHSFGDWTVVTPATCTQKGLEEHVCSVCGETEQREIAKIAHAHSTEWSFDNTHHWHACECGHKADYEKHTVIRVEDENGLKLDVCSVCGAYLGSAPTGDSILMYAILLVTAAMGLVVLATKKKEF